MNTFPNTVYKVPGYHKGFRGHTFDYAPVNDADELKAYQAKGWHLDIQDAIAATKVAPVIEEVSEAKAALLDIGGDLREALEVEAKALGVSFNSRTSDKVLAERIEAAR